MGNLAFDIDLKDYISAYKAIKKDKGKYICPNDECKERKVPVYLCEKSTGNCFVSYDKALHHPDCDFISAYDAAYHKAVLTNNSIEDIYQEIGLNHNGHQNPIFRKSTHDDGHTGKSSVIQHEIKISTLYQLYRYCSSNSPEHLVCGICIKDFFISKGTTPVWYERRRKLDKKLILACGWYSNGSFAKDNRIRIQISDNPKLVISIVFENRDDFKNIFDKLIEYQDNYDEKQRPVKICVMGYASSQSYSFPKGKEIIDYKEITISATPDFIHFLSRKRSSS